MSLGPSRHDDDRRLPAPSTVRALHDRRRIVVTSAADGTDRDREPQLLRRVDRPLGDREGRDERLPPSRRPRVPASGSSTANSSPLKRATSCWTHGVHAGPSAELQSVTHGVPVRVVDRLEVVDVAEEQPEVVSRGAVLREGGVVPRCTSSPDTARRRRGRFMDSTLERSGTSSSRTAAATLTSATWRRATAVHRVCTSHVIEPRAAGRTGARQLQNLPVARRCSWYAARRRGSKRNQGPRRARVSRSIDGFASLCSRCSRSRSANGRGPAAGQFESRRNRVPDAPT